MKADASSKGRSVKAMELLEREEGHEDEQGAGAPLL